MAEVGEGWMRATRVLKMGLSSLAAALCVAACGSDPGEETAGAGGAAGTNAAGMNAAGESGGGGGDATGPEVEIGVFGVQLVAPVAATATSGARPGSTVVRGSVGDKPATESKIWELDSENGGCKLLIPRVPFCDPSCGSGQICVEDGMCVAERAAIDVGMVTVRGVATDAGADNLTLISARNTYQNGTTTLPYPAFAEGDAITLEATGAGAVPAFSVESNGIAVLEVPAGNELVVTADTDLPLSWTPPADPSSSRILVKLDISHHGGEKGKIECDVEDTGELTLPAAMVSDLIALGVAGFPTVVITRSAIGTAQLPTGRVRLRIYQYHERSVTIPGVVSCESEAQCASGETCLDNKTCG